MDFESECTFVIPLRIDTPDRHANLHATATYLRTCYPRIRIVVLEMDVETKITSNVEFDKVFIPLSDCFCRGRAINAGIKEVKTPYAIIYDCDVFISRDAMAEGWKLLQTNDLVLPHNQLFVEITGATRSRLWNCDIAEFDRVSNLSVVFNQSIDPDIKGYPYLLFSGVVMVKVDTFMRLGGFNHKLFSYGYDDLEFVIRCKRMGLPFAELKPWSVFHLHHRRGFDSRINEYYPGNKEEFEKIAAFSQPELLDYINTELRVAL